jgi:hypothetical protein
MRVRLSCTSRSTPAAAISLCQIVIQSRIIASGSTGPVLLLICLVPWWMVRRSWARMMTAPQRVQAVNTGIGLAIAAADEHWFCAPDASGFRE